MTVTDFPRHRIDGFGVLIVVAQKIASRLIVPAPERQIIDSGIGCVSNDLFVVGDSILVDLQLLGMTGRESHFADRSRPGRTIAQRFDLGILDKDRVGPKPISGTHRSLYQIGVTNVAEIRLGVCC